MNRVVTFHATSRIPIVLRAIALTLCGFLASSVFANPGVEIIPIAVWQGKVSRPWSSMLLNEIRTAQPNIKMAHAVDPSLLIVADERQYDYRMNLAGALRPGDDVVLHIAGWKSLVEKSGVNFRYKPTEFGAAIVPEDCKIDCGLDLSFQAFSTAERKMIFTKAMDLLSTSGFGSPFAVIFEEGIVQSDIRISLRSAGIHEDWSGVDLTQLKGTLGRFPVFQWNSLNSKKFPLAELKENKFEGVQLDHVRYGIHAEVGDVETATQILKNALANAKSASRVVRIPIVFNVEDLIHTHAFVLEMIKKSQAMAQDAGIPIQNWTASNDRWRIDTIKSYRSSMPLAKAMTPEAPEAEFVPDEQFEVIEDKAH